LNKPKRLLLKYVSHNFDSANSDSSYIYIILAPSKLYRIVHL